MLRGRGGDGEAGGRRGCFHRPAEGVNTFRHQNIAEARERGTRGRRRESKHKGASKHGGEVANITLLCIGHAVYRSLSKSGPAWTVGRTRRKAGSVYGARLLNDQDWWERKRW